MSGEDWRIATDSTAYFTHQKKRDNIEARRPSIRRAADLVGPGIGANTVRLDDFSDLLATFNGYYSSEPGASNAPNDTDSFVGYTVSDATLGGRQVFTSLATGIDYSRTFTRSPVDSEALSWGMWQSNDRIIPTAQGYAEVDTDAETGKPTLLVAPNIEVNVDGVYERTDAGINIRRQGVYTGMVQVGDRGTGTTLSALAVWRPDGTETTPITQLSVPMAATVHIPFTVWTTNEAQAFSVTVEHAMGDTRALWWRFSCTRVGDAI